MGLSYKGEETNFPDISASHWAYNFIMVAKQTRIVSGFNNGTFQAGVNIPRVKTKEYGKFGGNFDKKIDNIR